MPIPPVPGGDSKLQWRGDAAKHSLICAGDGQHEWLRNDQEFGDVILQVEWRFTPKDDPSYKRYNSGIGVRLSKYGEIGIRREPVWPAAIYSATTSSTAP